jgi:hypothetical protein
MINPPDIVRKRSFPFQNPLVSSCESLKNTYEWLCDKPLSSIFFNLSVYCVRRQSSFGASPQQPSTQPATLALRLLRPSLHIFFAPHNAPQKWKEEEEEEEELRPAAVKLRAASWWQGVVQGV